MDVASPISPQHPDPDANWRGKPPDSLRFDGHRLGKVMEERPEATRNDSADSNSSDDFSVNLAQQGPEPNFDGMSDGPIQYTPGSTLDGITPLTGYSSSQPSWNSQKSQRPRADSLGEIQELPPTTAQNAVGSPRPQRPSAPARVPSSTYNPSRKPAHLLSYHGTRHRSFSGTRLRRDPNAQYKAQEKAYIQQLRQDPYNEYLGEEPYTPSLSYSTDSENDEESPSSDVHLDADGNYDQDTQLFFNTDDLLPSSEELQVPENRERLEWHSMLASVLKGDVVKQEKQRLIGTTEQKGEKALSNELWLGVRARVCGRSVPAQRRIIEEGRAGIVPIVENIIAFQVKGETEVGKPATKQVLDVVEKIEQCESLFPTRQALGQAIERAGSEAFIESSEAVLSWHNTTELINTELAVLRGWVGNDELDFAKAKTPSPGGAGLTDDSTFLERLHKDDSLTSLQGDENGKHSMLLPVAEVIRKAKTTLIKNATQFAKRHLPPYIEELLTLINFPSRLIQEIIRMRLKYVTKMKDPALLSPMMQTSMISQFQILLKMAVRIKQDYTIISQPEPGWELPPCIDDNFDLVVLDALKFYFKMLNAKLVGNRNTFKEAEILEQEWDFSNEIGRFLEGGDVEVAEQFSGLTAKALQRLTTHFERELTRRPDENEIDVDKRYKQILDSVRVRQRKLFRFSRLLSQRFENATEFNISLERRQLHDLYEALMESGHFLITSPTFHHEGIFLIASPSLYDRPRDIQSILGTSSNPDEVIMEDPSNPYVLIIRPDEPLYWDSRKMEMAMRAPSMDIRQERLRLVADGSLQRLQNARSTFLQAIGMKLDILTEIRANLPRVNMELGKIKKTAFKLSNTIMESVEIIRKQTKGLENQELIQTCFAFATEFGKRSVTYMDVNRRMMNNLKLTRLALDWVSFISDDCVASDRKTFKWAVVALEFAMVMTQGPNILSITDEEFTRLRTKVAGCMSLLISHFDIMGARSTLAAQAEKQRVEALAGQFRKMDISRMKSDAEASELVRSEWLTHLGEIDEARRQKSAERQALGRVMEELNDVDRSLTYLSSSATNVTMRWQQGQFVGGGTFGSVYAAINIDSGYLMAVKEIRLQDPQLIPTVAGQIRDEQAVLEVLDHPNIVSYYGIEVHRDKVYIFMEYCSGGSLANLLEHGRIEDETVVQVYALQMLEGLAYLHQSGIAHRDIKPENILLDHNGVIKYVDFGAARVIARQNKTLQPQQQADATTTPNGINAPNTALPKVPQKQKSMTGTPMYMSPEVIKGSNEGRLGAIDVWSLGCVILEMSTGRRPWASLDNEWAIMYNIAQGNPPQLPSREQLSEQGIEFLKRCFERDPKRRASAAELLQCEWIRSIRQQVVPNQDDSPGGYSGSGGSFSAGSSTASSSRQNSAQW
ncbi:Suppressor of Sensor Kinase (SLN1) [Lecanora helva]